MCFLSLSESLSCGSLHHLFGDEPLKPPPLPPRRKDTASETKVTFKMLRKLLWNYTCYNVHTLKIKLQKHYFFQESIGGIWSFIFQCADVVFVYLIFFFCPALELNFWVLLDMHTFLYFFSNYTCCSWFKELTTATNRF